MVINQGDIFWVDIGVPIGSAPGYRRPHVIIQNNAFNASRIQSVVICALTTNIQLANAPGNILLREGEGNLPRRSVVNVSQLFTVDKSELDEFIGTLSSHRIQQIVEGIRFVVEPRELEKV